MAGEDLIIKEAFEKAAGLPEDSPLWGTPPATDLPGEAKPEGLDTNQPVGDDAQNTQVLESRFNFADKTRDQMKSDLRSKLVHFSDANRGSSSQLIKNQPKTNARVYGRMSEVLKSRLLG